MSKLKHSIEISPPPGQEKNGEVFTVRGIPCGYCNGNGEFNPTQIGHNKYKENICPVCKGIGKMQAKVVVGWIPDNV